MLDDRARLRMMRATTGATMMKVEFRESILDDPQPVTTDAQMRVTMPDGSWVEFAIYQGQIEIRADRAILVRPKASNVVLVRAER
jgi:hypothetical protein